MNLQVNVYCMYTEWASTQDWAWYLMHIRKNIHSPPMRGERSKVWYVSSSTSILCVCKQQMLWRVCVYVQTSLSLHCSTKL